MILLPVLAVESIFTEVLIDASLLIALVYPVLYIFMLRPLELNINAQEESEQKLKKEIISLPKYMQIMK